MLVHYGWSRSLFRNDCGGPQEEVSDREEDRD